MFGNGPLTSCRQRKRVLIEQSEANRRVLAAEAPALRPVAAWMDLGIDVARKGRAAWDLLAPLLTLWQTQKQEPASLARKLTGAITIARSLTALWRQYFRRDDR